MKISFIFFQITTLAKSGVIVILTMIFSVNVLMTLIYKIFENFDFMLYTAKLLGSAWHKFGVKYTNIPSQNLIKNQLCAAQHMVAFVPLVSNLSHAEPNNFAAYIKIRILKKKFGSLTFSKISLKI